MPKLSIFLLLLLSFHYLLPSSEADSGAAIDFIKSECRATHYPALCVQCLSNYTPPIQQNQLQLAQAALSVSLSRARSTSSFVSKMGNMRGLKPVEYRALKDCIQNMGNTVDQLSRSVKELDGMGRVVDDLDFSWHISNVQTWISTALTDEKMCVGGFGGGALDGNVKVEISRRVLNCAQVTSNALALVNRFAESHNAGDSLEGTRMP